jgi:hypothetical protein
MSVSEKFIYRLLGVGVFWTYLYGARVGRGGSDGYGNCLHDNQGIV